MAKHVLSDSVAGVYAATTVAAKAVVWIAVGLGFWVLPEATRRAAAGADPRAVLARGLGVIGVISACALIVFATVPALLLRTAFGAEYETGETVLLALGAAYALLAAAYIGVQFLLGLRHRWFAAALGRRRAGRSRSCWRAPTTSRASPSAVLLVQALAACVALSAAATARTALVARPA